MEKNESIENIINGIYKNIEYIEKNFENNTDIIFSSIDMSITLLKRLKERV